MSLSKEGIEVAHPISLMGLILHEEANPLNILPLDHFHLAFPVALEGEALTADF